MAGDSDGPIGTGAANVAGFLGESAAVVTTREPPKRRFSNPPRPWPLLVISPVAPLSPWLCSSEPTRLGSLLLRVRFGCSTGSLLIFSAASACWFPCPSWRSERPCGGFLKARAPRPRHVALQHDQVREPEIMGIKARHFCVA